MVSDAGETREHLSTFEALRTLSAQGHGEAPGLPRSEFPDEWSAALGPLTTVLDNTDLFLQRAEFLAATAVAQTVLSTDDLAWVLDIYPELSVLAATSGGVPGSVQPLVPLVAGSLFDGEIAAPSPEAAPNRPPAVTLRVSGAGSAYTAPVALVAASMVATASDSDGAVARVDFYEGNRYVGTATAAPYAFEWPGRPAGTYRLTAEAVDDRGAVAVSPAVTATVSPFSIAIGSPLQGNPVTGNDVLVTGTVQAPPNAGVMVNTTAATVKDGRFYARVPLTPGENTLTAKVMAQGGQSTTHSVTVMSDGARPAAEAYFNGTEGIAPVTFILSAVNKGAKDATFTYNGNPLVTLAPGGSQSFTLKFDQPVTAEVTIAATDGDGRTSRKTFFLVVHDREEVDQLLQGMWTGMSGALTSGDKAGAMTYFSQVARKKYDAAFYALAPVMAEVFSTLAPLQATGISPDLAEYITTRPDENGDLEGAFIYFLRGGDGVWRIESM